ncbi:MAG: hypothetical protein KDJ19_06260 [Hyphomicrobiaceae bacterium]|nr:hypothetical protein [Hyphomicrobiaceae bacterium]MCC0025296.1 hypothetical protein [Hyphomicrobiaceae bacterium]
MSQPSPVIPPNPADAPHASSGAAAASPAVPDFSPRQIVRHLLGPVLIDGPDLVHCDGAIRTEAAIEVWKWMVRDLDPQLGNYAALALRPGAPLGTDERFARLLGDLIGAQHRAAAEQLDGLHRLGIQLGGEQMLEVLPALQSALRNLKLVHQAAHFGKTLNAISDRHALAVTLQSLPVEDGLLTHQLALAAIGQVSNPQILGEGMIVAAGASHPARIGQAGLGPYVNAIIAHAQNQIGLLKSGGGHFTDIDLACRVIARFHRFMRALAPIVEEDRRSLWFANVARLVGHLSELLRRRIEEVDSQIRRGLRPSRIGADSLDRDGLLDALNNMYLLHAAKDARESLALNQAIDTAWIHTGQSCETLSTRLLDRLREHPHDAITQDRIDFCAKIARVRFSEEYADVLARAKETIIRNGGSA